MAKAMTPLVVDLSSPFSTEKIRTVLLPIDAQTTGEASDAAALTAVAAQIGLHFAPDLGLNLSLGVRARGAMQQRLAGLDVLRGIAALAIVFAHTVLLNANPVPPGTANWAHAMTLAVPMFFALSAFSLAYKYYGRLGSRAQIQEYALRRFFRIAPLFYFMIGLWSLRRAYVWDAFPTMGDVVINSAFLFGLSSTHYESLVPAGWSIGVEMIFYASLPILFLAVRSVLSGLVATVVALIAGYVAYQATADFHTSFRILNVVSSSANFMGGLTAYFAYQELSKLDITWRRSLSVMFFGLAIVVWLAVHFFPTACGAIASYGWRYYISASFPLLILSAALVEWPIVVNRATVYLGTISYSVYLLHPFILAVSQDFRQKIYAALPDTVWVPFLVTTAFVYAAVIAGAFASYQLIERRGEALGKRLARPRPALAPAE